MKNYYGKNININLGGYLFLFTFSLYLSLKVNNKKPTFKSILASLFIPYIYIPYILSEYGFDIIWKNK